MLIESKGIREIQMSTCSIENKSASFPIIGEIIPPRPKASPIIRLATMDLPRGAKVWAITIPSGKVANVKNPARMAPR